jgi:hypothetical protein
LDNHENFGDVNTLRHFNSGSSQILIISSIVLGISFSFSELSVTFHVACRITKCMGTGFARGRIWVDEGDDDKASWWKAKL